MKNPLIKRIPREFKSNLGRYICILILLTTTVMLGAAFLVEAESAEATLVENQTNCKVEDGQFETPLPINDHVKDLLEEEGVTIVENFYATINEFDETAKVLIFDERKEINLATVWEGELPKKDNEVAIDRLFAANRDIAVGDTVEFAGVPFKVSGTMALPDYNSLFKSNQDVVMNTTDFGVAVTTEEGYDRFSEDLQTCRYSYRFNDRNLSKQEKRDIVAELTSICKEQGVMLQSFITEENNQSIAFLREDIGHDVPMMKIFSYILVVIIAFVFTVLTNNTIESEASIIGTLRASGYKKSEVVWHYMAPTLIVALIGSVVGNILGYTVLIKPLKEIYYTTYSMPPFNTHFSMDALFSSTLLPVILMIAINYIMLYRKLSLSPLRFLRQDLKRKKQKKAVKLPNFSFINRFRLRVILQNKGSYLVLFIGIFLSSFLLMFGLGLNPLMSHYVDEIDDSLPYEYQYILKAPVEAEGGEKLRTYAMNIYYPLAKTDIEVSFFGVSKDSEFFDFVDLPTKKDEIVITAPFAKKLGLEVGDELTFKDTYKEKEYQLKVAGITDYDVTIGAFMEQNLLNSMLSNEEDSFNCYISNRKLDIDDMYIAKYITRADFIGAADQMVVSFSGVISFINAFSIIIYIVLIYLLTKTVIEKNAIHISFMKVFGYSPKEIGKLYLNATTITVLTSLFICIPLEILGFKACLIYLSCLMEGYIEFYLPLRVYIEIIVMGIACYFGINALHVRRVRKISMGLALKNRE